MEEKRQFSFSEAQDNERQLVDRKGSTIGEAAVLYGDVETAERFGYVNRRYGLLADSASSLALTSSFLASKPAMSNSLPLAAR